MIFVSNNLCGSGISSIISRNSHKKKCVSGTVSYVPQAIGFGVKSGKSAWIADIDSNSPCIMFLPLSFDMNLNENDPGVPSARSTSIRPVLAQKVTPWLLVHSTSFCYFVLFTSKTRRIQQKINAAHGTDKGTCLVWLIAGMWEQFLQLALEASFFTSKLRILLCGRWSSRWNGRGVMRILLLTRHHKELSLDNIFPSLEEP